MSQFTSLMTFQWFCWLEIKPLTCGPLRVLTQTVPLALNYCFYCFMFSDKTYLLCSWQQDNRINLCMLERKTESFDCHKYQDSTPSSSYFKCRAIASSTSHSNPLFLLCPKGLKHRKLILFLPALTSSEVPSEVKCLVRDLRRQNQGRISSSPFFCFLFQSQCSPMQKDRCFRKFTFTFL